MYETGPRPQMISRVLIVDDDKVTRRAYSGLCNKLGYEAKTARDGEEALGIICKSETPFLAIFCDYQMPWMDGDQFLRNLRECPCLDVHKHTKVIGISSIGFPDERYLDTKVKDKAADIDDIRRCLDEVKGNNETHPYETATHPEMMQERFCATG